METIAYEELLQKDGSVITHVVGTSMFPLLYDRQSIVIVENVKNVPPQKGDVVLYKVNGTYILHRVMRIMPEEYLIRGDNTWEIEHIPKGALLATMTGFYRKPEGKLITRENKIYYLYMKILPGIRLTRKVGSKMKRGIKELLTIYS